MILIDGYNLLYACEGLRPKSARKFARDEQREFLRILSDYARVSGEKLLVVFDGTPPKEMHRLTHLSVKYSGAKSSADEVIKRLIRLSHAARDLTVVSSDREIRDDSRRLGARSEKALAFWEKVKTVLAEQESRSEQLPPEKLHGISPGEAQKWEEIFGLED